MVRCTNHEAPHYAIFQSLITDSISFSVTHTHTHTLGGRIYTSQHETERTGQGGQKKQKQKKNLIKFKLQILMGRDHMEFLGMQKENNIKMGLR